MPDVLKVFFGFWVHPNRAMTSFFFSDGVGWMYPRDLSFVMISQYHEVVETRCLRFHVETSTGKNIDESPTVSSSQGSGVILLMEQNPAPLRMPQMLG